VSGSKYYLVILDDFTHYLWAFPLKQKSDTFTTLSNFFAYVATQFSCTVKAIQCDNGREFDNSSTRTFLPSKGAQLRMSCPYTSPQNGKAERIIRTINNVIRTLLIQASLPECYWAEGLHTAVYLLNRLPTKTISAACPHVALFGSAPSYEHLRVFSCACYPNIATTAPHKLAPRSTRCVFLGYSTDHKGYRCPDLSTNRLIVSRHVVFDEDSFPLAASPNLNDLDFLLESGSTVSTIGTCPPLQVLPPRRPASPPRWFPRASSPLWLLCPHRQSLRDFCLVRPRRRPLCLTWPSHPPLRQAQPHRHLPCHTLLQSLPLRHARLLHLLWPRMVHHLMSGRPL
jgi:hypothetical protein